MSEDQTEAYFRERAKPEWAKLPKPRLPPGPWQDEPDRIEWDERGLKCLIIRHPDFGAFCGYAELKPDHPWAKLELDKVPAMAHGGLTFKGRFEDTDWLGFDTMHCFDVIPVWADRVYPEAEYRDAEYMRAAVIVLALQILSPDDAPAMQA